MDLRRSLLNQYRRPTGWLGRWNVRNLNKRHSGLTAWGLQHVSIDRSFTILDVGCGGGRTVGELATRAPKGRLYGIDHSEASVAASRATNRKAIAEGRVEIRQASVSRLPFPEDTFDLVTAVETHFYWPNLATDLVEILRVLKRGGALVLIAETYKDGKKERVLGRFAAAMATVGPYSHLTVEEHRELFQRAGYADAQVSEDYERGWICARGRKPETLPAGGR